MKLPAGVVKKRNSYFARIHVKGGEKSFPLGPDPGAAAALFYQVKAAIIAGRDPREVQPEEPQAEPVTVTDAAKRWLAERIDPELEPRNAQCIRSRVEGCLLPFLESKPIRALRRADCHAYKGHLRATRPDLKASTLHHYLRDLRQFVNFAMDVELIDSNPWPARGIMPKMPREEPLRFTDEEIGKLTSLQHPHGTAIALGLYCGLRWGEIVRATRRDITPNGMLAVRKTKTGRPRIVPMPKFVLESLLGYQGRFVPFSERCSGSFNKTVQNKTDIDHFHAHALRHEFSTRFREEGGDERSLQRILGHSTATMTAEYGTMPDRFVREDAARVFEAWAAAKTG